MDIKESVEILINGWMHKTGKEPEYLYIGHQQYREILDTDEISHMPINILDNLIFRGIPVVRIHKEDYLMVGDAIGL